MSNKEINIFTDNTIFDLDSVTGGEGFYPPFHRQFVLRKRQELVNPPFFNIGDVELPYNSIFHYMPNDVNSGLRGPSNNEAFISSYTKDVYVEFFDEYAPTFDLMGGVRKVLLETRKEIQAYRANHFKYKYIRDINVPLRKDKTLVVRNYALIDKRYVYRPHLFINYFVYHNRINNLIANINLESERSDRHQFIRMDLNTRLFSWSELLLDYDNYCAAFHTSKESTKDNLIFTPSNRALRLTKRDNSYWILDWMAFMFGDYQYSVFNKLSEKSLESLHILFTHNTKVLVIKLSTLKGWLDLLLDEEATLKEEGSNRESHRRRVNVSKRLYLIFLNMVNNVVIEEQLQETKLGVNDLEEEGYVKATEEEQETPEESEEEETQEFERVDEGKETLKGEKEKSGRKQGGIHQQDADVVTSGTASTSNAGKQGSGTVNEEPIGTQAKGKGSKDTGTTKGSTTKGDSKETPQKGGTDNQEEPIIHLLDISWDSEVDDSLLEVEEVQEVKVQTNKDIFKDPVEGIKIALENKAREGSLTVREQEFFLNKANKYKEIKLNNGQTVEEFMTIDKADVESLKEDSKIKGNFTSILDESMLTSRSKVLKSGYVKRILPKQIIQNTVAIQNAGIAVNDLQLETVTGVEGSFDVLSLQLHPVGGAQSTHHIRMPKVLDDGNFVIDGVKNHMQLQRMEVPIRKINHRQVALTSYYPSKVLISRDQRVVNDLSYWLPRQVIRRASEDSNITYDRGSAFTNSIKAPRIYSVFSSKFKWIKIKDVTLDFRYETLIDKHPEFKEYNTPDNFLVGVYRKQPVTIDSYGNISIGDRDFGPVEELLGIDASKAPKEFCTVNISGYNYPIGVVLCYYFGIDKLLEVVKAKYRTEPVGPRLRLDTDEYALTFSDEHLIFNRRDINTTLIFGGLAKLKNLRNFSRVDLNNKGIWVPLMDDVKVKISHFNEMNNLLDMFIDPTTKKELEKLKYSVSFHYLLIDAVKLLETDWSRAGSEIEEQRIVGYERLAGHLYRELCLSVRAYRNKGTSRKFKMEINPDIVLAKILTDTSVNQVEEVNPTHQLKEQEELTFGGTGGRNEISVVLRDRMHLGTNKGILSEAGKDSGKAGYVGYLTADPRIVDYSGNIDIKDKGSITGLRSVTGNLAVSTSKED